MNTDDSDVMSSSRFVSVYEHDRDQERISTVRRMDMPNIDGFFDLVAPEGYPVVFSNVGISQADPTIILSNLRDQYGSLEINVRIGAYDKPADYAHRREYLKISLAEYVETLAAQNEGTPPYAGNQPIGAITSEHLGIPPPPYFSKDEYEKVSLWLGPAGAITPLHKDSSENFAYHLFGAKRWVLYPPRDAPYLYLRRTLAAEGSDFAPSSVDFRFPDHDRFPDFKQAVPCEVTVYGGEMLYLPTGWAHYVENLDMTLMVNYWLHRLDSTPAVLLRSQGVR